MNVIVSNPLNRPEIRWSGAIKFKEYPSTCAFDPGYGVSELCLLDKELYLDANFNKGYELVPSISLTSAALRPRILRSLGVVPAARMLSVRLFVLLYEVFLEVTDVLYAYTGRPALLLKTKPHFVHGAVEVWTFRSTAAEAAG